MIDTEQTFWNKIKEIYAEYSLELTSKDTERIKQQLELYSLDLHLLKDMEYTKSKVVDLGRIVLYVIRDVCLKDIINHLIPMHTIDNKQNEKDYMAMTAENVYSDEYKKYSCRNGKLV